MSVEIEIKTLEGVEIPKYGTELSAGFDLVAHSFKKLFKGKKEIDLTKELQDSIRKGYITLRPFERVLVGTGLFVALPKGKELQIRPRSGMVLKQGITVLNSPGTVDADYRGEVGVILYNASQYLVTIELGERIAQAVLASHDVASFKQVAELSETQRGEGGFGSTGK